MFEVPFEVFGDYSLVEGGVELLSITVVDESTAIIHARVP